MATHDYVIDNSTGANVRADINSVLQAILTNNSSSSAPSTTAAYMFWADTTSGTLKIRNSSDNAWVELLQLDGTLTLEDGSASTPGLAFRDDLNTGIFSSASDTFNIATGGVERVEFGTATIFNDTGADVDLRIEGDTDQNLLFCNAGGNAVGIGTSTPGSKLHIFQSSASAATGNSGAGLSLESNNHQYIQYLGANTKEQGILFGDDADNDVGSIVYNHSDNKLTFATAANMRFMIDSSGRALLGTSTVYSATGGGTMMFSIAQDAATRTDVSISNQSSADNASAGLVLATHGQDYILEATGSGNSTDGASAFRIMKGSTERFKIDTSGNVMFGVSSTTNRFHVEGTTTGSRFGVDVSSSGIPAIAATNESNADVELVIYDGRSSIGSSVNIPIAFHTNGKTNERMRLTTSGELLVGMSNSQAVAGGSAKIQVQSNDSTGRISIVQHRNEAEGAPFLSLGKTRATSTNNSTLVQNGDNLGTIAFAGGDGTDIQSTAVQLVGVVSDNPGSNDMPGSLEIYTTPNGSDSPKKRINLTHKGEFQMGNTIGSGNILNQISRAEGNTTETFTLSQLGLDDNNFAMIIIVASGTNVRDYAHSIITWLMPLGNNSSINTQVDAMGSGSGVSTFTQAVNGNDLVITKDSDLALNVTVIGGGGRRTTIGWG